MREFDQWHKWIVSIMFIKTWQMLLIDKNLNVIIFKIKNWSRLFFMRTRAHTHTHTELRFGAKFD
jgi:hypothetical protein